MFRLCNHWYYRDSPPIKLWRSNLYDIVSGNYTRIQVSWATICGPNILSFVVTLHYGHFHVDYLIDTTGQELDVSRIRSPLLKSPIWSNIIEKCHLGRLSLDQHMLGLKYIKGIYATGSLTTSRHFYTYGIDRNAVHAACIARCIRRKPLRLLIHVAIMIANGQEVWLEVTRGMLPCLMMK
jgi:hypothetical protein